MIVGYARVSTDGQGLDAQQSALAGAGAERVFAEKVSGAVTERKALARAIAALGPGDILLVTRRPRDYPSERHRQSRAARSSAAPTPICGLTASDSAHDDWASSSDPQT
jgi:hypothetical protein